MLEKGVLGNSTEWEQKKKKKAGANSRMSVSTFSKHSKPTNDAYFEKHEL